MDEQLKTVAQSIATNMATFANVPEPEVKTTDPSETLLQHAFAREVEQFYVRTLFGFEVRVTVARMEPLR